MKKLEKMKRLYDSENDVRGYELNGKYLLKIYYSNYGYNWVVSNRDFLYIMSCDYDRLKEEGTITIVHSFKEGKKILLDD